MSSAILTIDDSPTAITPAIVDCLLSRGITPVLNFIGAGVEEHFAQAVYAVERSALIGNHSFMHDHFSALSVQACREEIAKTEREIDRVHQAAGVKRAHRFFRFPYGDKGGAQQPLLQRMLRDEFAFEHLDDSAVTFPYRKKYRCDTDIDMMWTFDFLEYRLAWNDGFTWDDIVRRVHDKHPAQGGSLLCGDSVNIVLMHDHEQTNGVMKGYFERLIDYALQCGVTFVPPRFVRPDAAAPL